jgi:hypothetical protein
MLPNFIRPERISLRFHPDLNERWVQDLIAADPSILGLGDLVLRDKERAQPRAGRLDLLLQDPETKRRYEVEIQLGATDETHVIRGIEYWDIERRRYPQYDHCAVLIAEEITSRFLNVISLFNGAIPLIAIQMQALKIRDDVTLVFTKVLDELSRGLVDEDEDAEAAPSDRAYWEARGSKQTVQLADELLSIARVFDPSLQLKYNRFYIGLAHDGQPYNFVIFRPRKRTTIAVEIGLPRSDDIDARLEAAGIDTLEYSTRWRKYRISLDKETFTGVRSISEQIQLVSYLRSNAFGSVVGKCLI